MWAGLLGRRRGYAYSARVLSRILGLFRAAKSTSYEGPTDGAGVPCSGLYQKGLWALFAAERENSYYTIQNRKGTPSFQIEEVSNILFLCGRKMADGPPGSEPSIHKQNDHLLLKDAQESRFMVPVISPHTALGMAVAQTIHDQTCGSSPATCMARATKYFYFCPGPGKLFQTLQDNCFKCS